MTTVVWGGIHTCRAAMTTVVWGGVRTCRAAMTTVVWGEVRTCRAAMTTVLVSGASLLDRRVVLPITEDQALDLNECMEMHLIGDYL